ncbi:DUF305 domain-containing protein [Nonomuraea sp. NPDC005983]|uniref:DUF305 domain-containing protein n=1 Tax=Nonomuraea sp. NPDC005983 TaxID=3155595 RepID=UPI0033AED277
MSAKSPARVFLVALLASLALAGCAEEPEQPQAVGTGAPVIVPQGPGTSARTATPGERVGEQPPGPVAADVRFAEAMIPHHRQALEMTGMVKDRTTNAEIRRYAEQIAVAQQPEIKLMTDWLGELGRSAPAGHAHAQTGDGMADEQELNQLGAARGAAFDRLFLTLMIRHHGGAVRMAGEELKAGQDQRMRLMAKDVYSGQSIEISRMRATLDSLPG